MAITTADTAAGEYFCLRCKLRTRWLQLRRVQYCEGCGDCFPCKSRACGHSDCAEARK